MKKIKVAIQGFEGSYSHQAVKEVFGKNNLDFELVENLTFSEVFQSIKKYGVGLIPVENSTAGFVDKTIDELSKYNFQILGEYFLDINHTLLGNKKVKLKNISEVHSHHQALMQTSDFLEKNKIEMIDSGDTAGGAKIISDLGKNNLGAIGSEILADIYDLDILARKINNEKENTTRFLLIAKNNKIISKIKTENNYKTAVIFKTKNIPGALYKALGGFATNGVDLTKIISRPIRNKKFGYLFYLEFQGSQKDRAAINALEELNFFSDEIISLGSFSEII